jgi:hypothetical protein
MKTTGLFLILSVAILASGCYTQLALNNDGPEAEVASEPLVAEPPPIVIVVEPIFVPIVPPYYPPPAVGVPSPSPVTQPDHTIRDIGNQRGPSGRPDRSDTGSRSIGSARGGR